MMVRSKNGSVTFNVTDVGSGTQWLVEPSDYLTTRQMDDLAGRPDMILQFGHYLRDRWQASGYDQIEVRAQGLVSLNGRPPQPQVDPQVDLAALPRRAWPPASWIVPLLPRPKS
jgi:hypothetical protein